MHTEEAHGDTISTPAGRSGPALTVRLRGLALLLSCTAVLAVAWSMNPRTSGYGTHQELGLPACSFIARYGYPCPSCGMTTSVSAAARGRLGEAVSAQPAGAMLVAAVLVFAATGAVELISGQSAIHRLKPGLWWLGVAVGMLLLGWVWKLVWGFGTGQYPLH